MAASARSGDRFFALFDDAMARFAPFEPAPHIAVAVSGGRDSMALALLAHRWARRRHGQASALIVDHGLRPEAGTEAALVRRRLRALGISCHVLRWRGPKPATGIQAAARAARYRLLEAWCARHAVLHLLTAHQADDQAETVLMRRRRGSGPDGQAGMAGTVERTQLRLLRPLLGVPRASFAPFLARRGIAWIDDPTNENPHFARSAIRAELAAGPRPAARRATLVAAARGAGARRAARERRTAQLLARHAAIFPAGHALIPRSALVECPLDIAERALTRLLGSVGGGAYPPRGERLRALLGQLRGKAPFRGRTLGGCRILGFGESLLFVREARAPGRRHRQSGGPHSAAAAEPDQPGERHRRLAPLGEDGWRLLLQVFPSARDCRLPHAVRVALPAWWDGQGLLAVPYLGYGRDPRQAASLVRTRTAFRPLRPLCPAEFSVA